MFLTDFACSKAFMLPNSVSWDSNFKASFKVDLNFFVRSLCPNSERLSYSNVSVTDIMLVSRVAQE